MRDGLVERDDRESGQAVYTITPDGRETVKLWLTTPVKRETASRDESVMKLSIAVTLPGVDIANVVQIQRSEALRHLQELTRIKNTTTVPESADELAWVLTIDSMIFATEGEIRWLDHSEERLLLAHERGMAPPRPLSNVRPARGRPRKVPVDD